MTEAFVERVMSNYENTRIAVDDCYFAVLGVIDGVMTEAQAVAAMEAAGPLTMTTAEKNEFSTLLGLIPDELDLSELVGLILPPVADALEVIAKQPQYNWAHNKVRYAFFENERQNPMLDTAAKIRTFLGLPTP